MVDPPQPFTRALAECRAQLDQIGASFLVKLQSLLRALEAQPEPTHSSTSDLRFLLCRLDFNAYYEARRLPPRGGEGPGGHRAGGAAGCLIC